MKMTKYTHYQLLAGNKSAMYKICVLHRHGVIRRSATAPAFQNGMEDRNADARLNDNDFSTSCRNLLRFGPATP